MDVVNDRDADWFRGIYGRHYPDVVRYGLRRLGGTAAAEELAQEVFLVAWRRRWEVPARTLPWLYGVGRRLLANHWRAERATPPALELREVPSADRHDGVTRLVDVRAALARLSDDDQEILRLVGWEQLSVSEAALVLGCGAATAKVRLHRARRRLTDLLREQPAPAPVRIGGSR
ncbi:sigma-70 family RNA polymerase sigma factor [Dactylosporangium sp. NPDC051484]|uniref:RNA polymerase sigma factor n=1 Tax=Dactylosporangium sp. NPDC051484 TaxID=3154942 RepID=UPI00344BD0FC